MNLETTAKVTKVGYIVREIFAFTPTREMHCFSQYIFVRVNLGVLTINLQELACQTCQVVRRIRLLERTIQLTKSVYS